MRQQKKTTRSSTRKKTSKDHKDQLSLEGFDFVEEQPQSHSQSLGLRSPEAVNHFEWHLEKAQQGDASCQFTLGLSYLRGFGVTRSVANAVRWFQAAADQGHTKAAEWLDKCAEPRQESHEQWYRYTAYPNSTNESKSTQKFRAEMRQKKFRIVSEHQQGFVQVQDEDGNYYSFINSDDLSPINKPRRNVSPR